MAYKNLSPKATYVARGYGQVEPNHLSARRTGEIFAQLPAAKDINILENGMFVKYDYAKGVVDFEGRGEWMLVFNEVKIYRDREQDHDFAMIKTDYNARMYSPVNGESVQKLTVGKFVGETDRSEQGLPPIVEEGAAYDVYRFEEAAMPEGTKMVPRVLKTHEGDIFTTNCVAETTLVKGDLLTPGADGYLTKTGADSADMQWEVVKVYNMPDMQPGVKLMRIK